MGTRKSQLRKENMNKMYPCPPLTFNKEDNKRIVYICGPHGVGKSTLLNDLKTVGREKIREQLAHHESLQEQVTRQLWRAALHCIEHRENLSYVHKLPSRSVVVGDRCFLDDVAYVNAFLKLKWMKPEECQNIFTLTNEIYKQTNTPLPEMFVILLPPSKWNKERIEERWNRGEEPKWCELNFNYLKAIRDEFLNVSKCISKEIKGKVIVVRDTDRLARINKINGWLTKHDLEDFIVEGETIVESPVGTGS